MYCSEWIDTFPRCLNNCISNFSKNNTQTNAQLIEQTVGFAEVQSTTSLTVGGKVDRTYDYGLGQDDSLGEFYKRPIKIHEILWSTTTSTFDNTIDPWSLLVNNTYLKKRMEGFKLFRANLCVRIVVNGNPFVYGSGLVSYYPRTSDMRLAVNTDAAINCEMSVLPHLMIDPTQSSALEMELPFFCPDNFIELNGGTISQMGRLRFKSVNALRHTSGAMANPIQISVFAWFTDVVLSGPTSQIYGAYTIQSGDEYSRSPVSTIASAIAKVSGALESVPIIGLYARATTMAASTLANIAIAFGFSRPAIVDKFQRVKQFAMGNMANTDQPEAVVKLALDSKQELCVDPRTVGLSGEDEMAISYIVSKEALFLTKNWNPTMTDGTQLALLNVNPLYYVPDSWSGSTVQTLINTPLSTVSSCFKYWKGTIRFRFQVIASAFHRGRLRVVYDPCVPATTDPGYNQVISRIVDLSSVRDFTFDVVWHSHRGWLQTGVEAFAIPNTTTNYSGAALDLTRANGTLSLLVCNQLTTPDPTNVDPVYVNIFISAGPDFEVAAPTDFAMRNLTYVAQSGYELQSGIEEMNPISGDAPYTVAASGGQWGASPSSHVFMGESVASIRSLLKRYCYHSVFGAYTPAQSFWWREYNFPYYPGRNLGTNLAEYRHTSVSATRDINICSNVHLHWFVPCYAGWRGGLRSKYVYPTDGTIFVRRDTHTTGNINYELQIVNNSGDDDNTKRMWRIMSSGMSALHVAKSTIDGALEVEFPFYAEQRFAPARAFIATTSNDKRAHTQAHLGMVITGDAQANFGLMRFVAAGDDFSTFFFTGQPLLKYGDMVWPEVSELELPSDTLEL